VLLEARTAPALLPKSPAALLGPCLVNQAVAEILVERRSERVAGEALWLTRKSPNPISDFGVGDAQRRPTD
jgi:hypothetical protein